MIAFGMMINDIMKFIDQVFNQLHQYKDKARMRVSCGSDPLFGCQQNLAGAEELFSSFKILCWKSTYLRFLNSMGQCLCIDYILFTTDT